jgi:hypothetical protein
MHVVGAIDGECLTFCLDRCGNENGYEPQDGCHHQNGVDNGKSFIIRIHLDTYCLMVMNGWIGPVCRP